MLKSFLVVLQIICLQLTLMPCVENVCAAEASPEGETAEMPSLEKMLGSMLMFGFREARFKEDSKFFQMLKAGKIGSVILFDKDVSSGKVRNIENPEQLRALCSELHKAGTIFIGIDQEGGQVRRLKTQKGFGDLPSAQAMGQESPHATFQKAEILGAEMKKLGINLDFAPVVDVDSNPYNPVIGRLGRSFSSDPAIVASHALAFGRGLAKQGVIPVLKHFPGQGCADKDSHLEFTDISACWKADVDLLPYAEIFQAGWPGMVMTGHIFQKSLDSDNPATLSKNIIDGLLRTGLGWQGVVISDDLQMKALGQELDLKGIIEKAVNAGVDILLFSNNMEWDENLPDKALQALNELIAENRISEERIRQSWARISSLRNVYEHMQVREKPASAPEQDDSEQLLRQIN